MKTISSPSLADIELELPLRHVTDDLAVFTDRLSLSAGAERGYASFAAETHPIGEITERAIGHGIEITRFTHLQAWAQRLAALPGFALPYDLIPKKDAEFDSRTG